MKKNSSLFVVCCFLLLIPSYARAVGPGINIGTKYSDIDRAIDVVGSGGWIVVIAGGTGDCTTLNTVIAKTDSANVNLIIRGHLGNKLSPQDAIAWTATLGQLNNSKKVYFMPWNEPNQGGADGGTASEVKAYTSALITNMQAAGIWEGKIRLLSPMLNHTHPNFDGYLNELGGSGFYSPFYGAAMNLYDVDTDDGPCSAGGYQPLCSNNPHYNPTMATSFAGNKPVFGVESGSAGTYFYFKTSPAAGGYVHSFVNKFKDQSNAVMFAIPSYDLAGEIGHSWNLFSPPDTTNLLSSMPKSGTENASFSQTGFNNWLNPLVESGELIPCGNCGFAHSSNPNLCQGTGGLSNFTLPSECDLNQSGDQTSRPVACQICNQTSKMVSSCATSFTVFDKVSYEKREGDFCDEEWWVEKSWGGIVSLDLNSTEIPFVGKKGEENEQYYLADYFEGTYPYYTTNYTPYNLMSGEEQRQAFMQGGVWSKLATRDMQDAMKKRMIIRAVASKNGTITEDVIRDYEVILYNPDGSVNLKRKLTDFVGHYPPEDETQRQEWIENDDFGKLWFKVPMFTREDTKGSVVPYLGSMPKDQFTIQDAETSTVEKVPHVARLYEVSRAINQMLLPATQQALITENKTQKNLASNLTCSDQATKNTKLLASKEVLLAQACQNCLVPSIVNPSVSGGQVHYSLQICPSCSGYGTIGDVYMGSCGNVSQVHNVEPSCFSSDNSAVAPPVPITCPGTATICASVRANRDVAPSCQGQTISTACNITVDAGCNVTSSTCGSAPPAPVCGPFTAQPVSQCEKEADTGPGDTICCGTINSSLAAVDRINNTDHVDCNSIAYPFGIGDPCHDNVDADVQRSLGVALSHPYLEKIWEDTTDLTNGFINLWRPADNPNFEPKEAKSTINYSFSGGRVEPSTGDFYYPYLGGIFNAKNWLVNLLLTQEMQDNQNGLPDASANLFPTGTLANDTSKTLTDAKMTLIVAEVLKLWPNSKIAQWQYVQQQAIANGWNPALVIALWIEESGASGTNAYDFGCLAATPNNIDSGLNCLFTKISYHNDPFDSFLCKFSEGHYPCTFDKNPNFVVNLNYWYTKLVN